MKNKAKIGKYVKCHYCDHLFYADVVVRDETTPNVVLCPNCRQEFLADIFLCFNTREVENRGRWLGHRLVVGAVGGGKSVIGGLTRLFPPSFG